MRIFNILVLLVSFNLSAKAQGTYTISLKKLDLPASSMPFTISELIDARVNKNSVGIVQRGSKPDLAVFDEPGLDAVYDLFSRSGMISADKGLVVRITLLKISEISSTWNTTDKAEVSMDILIADNGSYYYICTLRSGEESTDFQSHNQHGAHLVAALRKALMQYNDGTREPNVDRTFTREELLDTDLSFSVPELMPILLDPVIKEGYYVSFDEFTNNKPSISIDCKVKLSSPVVAKCGEETSETTLFGYARDNQLFIYLHDHFYPLERRGDRFYFYGPGNISKVTGNNVGNAGVFLGAAAIPLLLSNKYKTLYILDLQNGSVRNVTGL